MKQIKVTGEMLPDYLLKIIKENNFCLDENKILIPNIGNNRKYIIHCQNAKLYLRLKTQLKEIHRTL